MTDYREILRMDAFGISNSRISDSLKCSRNTVSSVLKAAEKAGIDWQTA